VPGEVPLGVAAIMLLQTFAAWAADPVVSNVRASQRPGTKLVDIYYDLADPDSSSVTVSVAVSTNGGASYSLPASSLTGALGAGIAPGSNKQITWNAGADWNGQFSANVRFRVTADDAAAPSGMVLIPAGSFTMGNCMDPGEGFSDELPLHTNYVSAFYMDRYEVTKALWDEVYNWAITHGYSFEYGAQGKASDHPAHSMTWYDAVKWCNARSEKEGRTPAYYTDAGLSMRYRSGQVNVQTNWVNWSSGYRLPTEAEWEKAARGGASGQRFPWSDVDTITHSRANYYVYQSSGTNYYVYDQSPTVGYHLTFATGDTPYTSPVGSFAANGYGVYDMAGNVWERCWDWYGSYSSGSQTDPRGPASGSYRVDRGGGWYCNAVYCRAAYRDYFSPYYGYNGIGFRSVRPPGQ
jgi:formylglycine-generating enzyme